MATSLVYPPPNLTIITLTTGERIPWYRSKQVWRVLWAVICTIAGIYLSWKLTSAQALLHLWNGGWKALNPVYGMLALLLLPLNWSFEVWKWRAWMSKHNRPPFAQMTKGALAGSAVSFVLPNRSGDFLGRIGYLPANRRVYGALTSIWSGVAGMVITCVIGAIALAWYLPQIEFGLGKVQLTILTLIVVIGFPLLYLLTSQVTPPRYMPRRLRAVRLAWILVSRKSGWVPAKVLTLSLLRYLTFSTQYLLLIKGFGGEVMLPESFLVLGLIFLSQSVLPATGILELGVRGVVGCTFFPIIGVPCEVVLGATYTLWIINVMFPALPGLYFLYRSRLWT